MYNDLLEYTYKQFKNKQKSVTTLHPKYIDRVKSIVSNGGAKLFEITPEYWHFKVVSGTKTGVKYDVYLAFKDIPDMIRKYGSMTKTTWKKDGSGINASLLADAIYAHVDLEASCSCESDLYSGFKYIRTQRDANYGDPENRAPVKKNPRELGFTCKHIGVVLNRLPFYSRNTLANYLIEFFAEDIQGIEVEVTNRKEQTKYMRKFKSTPGDY